MSPTVVLVLCGAMLAGILVHIVYAPPLELLFGVLLLAAGGVVLDGMWPRRRPCSRKRSAGSGIN